MPSKKQRKRREKERRHEYELVLIDETGEERPIDSAELRAERQQREAAQSKGRATGKDGKKVTAKSRSGRPIREVPPPAWNRVWKRTAFLGVFMFIVLTFVGGKHKSWTNVIVPTVLYTALFAPFLYLLDRMQYNQYLKRTGQPVPPRGSARAERPAEKPDDGEPKGPVASIRRALRR